MRASPLLIVIFSVIHKKYRPANAITTPIQVRIQYTTVGKAGFITTFYIIIVPVVGLFFKKYCGILTLIGVVIALAGLYFLCITEKMTIKRGDALIL